MVIMGRFHELLDNSGDAYLIARESVDLWISEFMREIGDTQDKDLRHLLDVWFGQPQNLL